MDVLKGSKSILTLYDNEEWRRIRRAAGPLPLFEFESFRGVELILVSLFIAHAFSPTSLRAQMPVLEKVLATWLRKLDAVAGTALQSDSRIVVMHFTSLMH